MDGIAADANKSRLIYSLIYRSTFNHKRLTFNTIESSLTLFSSFANAALLAVFTNSVVRKEKQ